MFIWIQYLYANKKVWMSVYPSRFYQFWHISQSLSLSETKNNKLCEKLILIIIFMIKIKISIVWLSILLKSKAFGYQICYVLALYVDKSKFLKYFRKTFKRSFSYIQIGNLSLLKTNLSFMRLELPGKWINWVIF